jgi:hypothetical protein
MRSLVVVAFTLLVASVGLSQDPVLKIDTTDERLEKLEVRIGELERLLKQSLAQQGTEAAAPDTSADSTSRVDSDEAFRREIRSRLQALEERLPLLAQQAATGSSGDLPNIFGTMERDPAVRADLFKATNGRFEVHNHMGTWMSVRVNGQSWQFPPGVSSIYVPFGFVQVQLVDGGDRHTFDQSAWRIVGGEHLLKMGITTQLPRQE